MIKAMEKVNLFWAIVMGVLCLTAIVGMFWNPSHYITVIITAVLCGMFIHDYRQEKKLK